MNHYAIAGFFTFLSNAILGVVVYFKNPKKNVNCLFSLFSISVAIYGFGFYRQAIALTDAQEMFVIRILLGGTILIPAFFIHLVYAVLEKKLSSKSVFCIYLTAGMLEIINFSTNWLARDPIPKFGFRYLFQAGILYPLLALYFAICVVKGAWQLFHGYRSVTGLKRNQLKYIFFSTLIGFGGGSAGFALGYNAELYPLNPFGAYCVPLYCVIFAYAIIKYHLMDIRIFTLRGLVFGIVYAAVLGIPLGLVKLGKLWLKTIFGEGWFWLPIFILFGLATLGPIIYNYIRRKAEDAILKEEHRYQSILRKFSATMTLVKDLNQLLKLIVYRVNKTVKVKFSSIYLADNLQSGFVQKFIYTSAGFSPEIAKEISYNSRLNQYLKTRSKPALIEELNVEIKDEINLKTGFIIPCFIHQQLLGFLVLGQKTSGQVWSEGDIRVFEVLASQAGLAIENSLFLEESQKNQAQLFATERMASLGTMAGGMTHQINNRFHVIALASCDALDTLKLIGIDNCSFEMQDSLKSVQHALEAIIKNTEHGGKIVNDFLNFSQPERTQKEAKIFDITEPLQRAIEMLKIKTALDEGIIVQEIQPNLPLIEGNFVLLQDCFFNLLNNDMDAISLKKKAINDKQLPSLPEGYKGKIIIRIYKIDSHLIVQFHDNGIGMTKDTQKKIFVPFFTTKATSIKGTGLGLFVIQKIIASHRGEISVESCYGEGTTFTIKLPVNQQMKER